MRLAVVVGTHSSSKIRSHALVLAVGLLGHCGLLNESACASMSMNEWSAYVHQCPDIAEWIRISMASEREVNLDFALPTPRPIFGKLYLIRSQWDTGHTFRVLETTLAHRLPTTA